MSKILEIDDQDPNILYRPTSSWETKGRARGFNRTTRWTGTKGATLQVGFIGTRVEVFGSISPRSNTRRPPLSSYIVDNNKRTYKTYTGLPLDVETQYKVSFYIQENLSPDVVHQLLIRNDEEEDYFWIDFIRIIGDRVEIAPALSATATPATPPITTDTQVTEQVDKAKPISVGAIVGGVLGGIVLLAFIVAAIYFSARRRRLQRDVGHAQSVGYSSKTAGRFGLFKASTPPSSQAASMNELNQGSSISPYTLGSLGLQPVQKSDNRTCRPQHIPASVPHTFSGTTYSTHGSTLIIPPSGIQQAGSERFREVSNGVVSPRTEPPPVYTTEDMSTQASSSQG
ncbi:hypothetical protein D9611_009656 [Ephemerocybe angulata]|uniref:Uncharacterized protein n=1 Tax=Ephemerocybe angulata TaxID=980116 RepID=A0A8H5C8A2_9AGAR|nr:hypothetical protein D9611_009656 [Tulosesus angulatus]